MNIHIIIHESFEWAAAIEHWGEVRGHTISYTRLYKGDMILESCDNFDCLMVMGGPQSPATTLEECAYFDAWKELKLIRAAIDNDKVVFGVCLGAQMIWEALGAKATQSPNREIGVFDITLTNTGKNDEALSLFPDTLPVGHWHGDMPGITNKSQILAFSQGCPRQIIKYGSRVYWFQCHLEFTADAIDSMIKNCADELKEYADLPYVQSSHELRLNDYDNMNHYLFNFLDYIGRTE